MRLIDADRFKAYMQEEYLCFDHTLADIDAQPTVDPVKHGQWYDEPNYLGTGRTMFFCSKCGSASYREDPYCWHCGAKMDEVEDER